MSAHGLRGEVKARLHNPNSNALQNLQEIILVTREGVQKEFPIEYVHPIPKKGFILGLDGVDDRNMADTLKGSVILGHVSELDELNEDEFFLEHIRGFEAFDEKHQPLGKVTGFLFTNIDIVLIERTEGSELLVPLLEDTILEMDPGEKTIRVQLPEGLLEE
jgi:16S rRNA processing protein RimM